ncbi:MAG: hldD [Chlamydiales bacterium]|jgi:ADP-L-glycero-D-manno-heptose 6-epimerase|nr:hldD [Chlamydiales bacterium]
MLSKEDLICITGGAGFIGSALIRQLNNGGFHRLLIVDSLGKSEKWKNLVGKQFVDLIDKSALFDWLAARGDEVKAFVHLGACSSTVETDASYLLENNYRFSVKLAEYALKHQKRMVYASSAATYGDGSFGFDDDEDFLDQLAPLNMYGYSKHLFDLWAKREGALKHFAGLKYFNVFGPNEYHKGRMSSAIVKLLPEILKSGSVSLFKSDDSQFADGGQLRDFIYVKDVVQATQAFLMNRHSGIYNIGTGKARSWNDLATSLFQALQLTPRIHYIDMPEDLVGKYQNFTEAVMRKTTLALPDWRPRTLEESVQDYVPYLLRGERW